MFLFFLPLFFFLHEASFPEKYIENWSYTDIYDLCVARCKKVGDKPPSKTSLIECYKSRWSKVLVRKEPRNQGRCDECSDLLRRKANATDAASKAEWADKHDDHCESVMGDRQVQGREDALSMEAARSPSVDGHGQIIKWYQDGADQAKFKVPRENCPDGKARMDLWKPVAHVTGVIGVGHVECYYLMDQDMAKDPNMQLTCLSTSMDLVDVDLTRKGAAMPKTCLYETDGTCREGRSQTVQTFANWIG